MNTNNQTLNMIVQLNKSQFDSLKFYTGINADRYIATKEDAIKYLSAFLSKYELDYLKSNNCNYSVTFELEEINKHMIQKVK